MTDGIIALAQARAAARPDLYTTIVKPAGTKSGYDKAVHEMVFDLKATVPNISVRNIAAVLRISKTAVADIINSADEDDFIPNRSNEEMCADELAALVATGREGYTDDAGSRDEYRGGPVIVSAPLFQDRYRRADQSHTKPPAITLPSAPFVPLRLAEIA